MESIVWEAEVGKLRSGEGRGIMFRLPGESGSTGLVVLPLKKLSENPIGSSFFGGLVRELKDIMLVSIQKRHKLGPDWSLKQ